MIDQIWLHQMEFIKNASLCSENNLTAVRNALSLAIIFAAISSLQREKKKNVFLDQSVIVFATKAMGCSSNVKPIVEL